MALPVVEIIGWALWEFVFAVIFYNTGALLIRIFSAWKVKYPYFWSRSFDKDKAGPKNVTRCYIAGALFYMSILFVTIFVITS